MVERSISKCEIVTLVCIMLNFYTGLNTIRCKIRGHSRICGKNMKINHSQTNLDRFTCADVWGFIRRFSAFIKVNPAVNMHTILSNNKSGNSAMTSHISFDI